MYLKGLLDEQEQVIKQLQTIEDKVPGTILLYLSSIKGMLLDNELPLPLHVSCIRSNEEVTYDSTDTVLFREVVLMPNASLMQRKVSFPQSALIGEPVKIDASELVEYDPAKNVHNYKSVTMLGSVASTANFRILRNLDTIMDELIQ